MGGFSPDVVGKDFFYIDFSVPFNTRNLILKDLSNINTVPPHYSAASAKGGVNNNTLFIELLTVRTIWPAYGPHEFA
jgi:hypothetical protein